MVSVGRPAPALPLQLPACADSTSLSLAVALFGRDSLQTKFHHRNTHAKGRGQQHLWADILVMLLAYMGVGGTAWPKEHGTWRHIENIAVNTPSILATATCISRECSHACAWCAPVCTGERPRGEGQGAEAGGQEQEAHREGSTHVCCVGIFVWGVGFLSGAQRCVGELPEKARHLQCACERQTGHALKTASAISMRRLKTPAVKAFDPDICAAPSTYSFNPDIASNDILPQSLVHLQGSGKNENEGGKGTESVTEKIAQEASEAEKQAMLDEGGRTCTGVLASRPTSRWVLGTTGPGQPRCEWQAAVLFGPGYLGRCQGDARPLLGFAYTLQGKTCLSDLLASASWLQVPIPKHMDIFHLRTEAEPEEKTALNA
eukprot:1150291-Pelagomonas_calceolata.AAC.4